MCEPQLSSNSSACPLLNSPLMIDSSACAAIASHLRMANRKTTVKQHKTINIHKLSTGVWNFGGRARSGSRDRYLVEGSGRSPPPQAEHLYSQIRLRFCTLTFWMCGKVSRSTDANGCIPHPPGSATGQYITSILLLAVKLRSLYCCYYKKYH